MDKDYSIKIVANWLKDYNNEVVVKVMEKYEQIINDKTTYTMLSKLYEEEHKEELEFISDIQNIVENGVKNETKDIFAIKF